MSATPLPTKLVFLNELAEIQVEEKVRFLGCVTKYDVPTGILTLKHHYPSEAPKPAKTFVDLNLLLGTLKSTDVQIGSWINVFGYVKMSSHGSKSRVGPSEKKGATSTPRRSLVKALMIQSAGPINVGEYERVVAEGKEAREALEMSRG